MPFELNTIIYFLLITIAGATTFVVIRNGRHPDVHPRILHHQGSVSTFRSEGETAVVKSGLSSTGIPKILETAKDNDNDINHQVHITLYTLSELYQRSFIKFKKNQFLGSRKLNSLHKLDAVWSNYGDVMKSVKSIYSGLIGLTNLQPCTDQENSFVGIYASNSPDVYMIETACHWGGLVTVPIPAQATPYHLLHVIRSTSLKVLAIDEGYLEYELEAIKNAGVTHIIIIPNATASAERENDINFEDLEKSYSFESFTRLEELQKYGNEHPVDRSNELKFDSIASIYYSKDSKTKLPDSQKNKHNIFSLGVVLTHGNIISAILNYTAHFPTDHKVTSKDRLMHCFAIDNVLGYVLQALITLQGGSIAFEDKVEQNAFVGITNIFESMKALEPTIYASDPFFLKQVQKHIHSMYGNSFLFMRGLDRKNKYLDQGRLVSECFYDMIVFRFICSSLFGGKIRVLFIEDDLVTKMDLASFYRVVLGAQVLKTLSLPHASSSVATTVFYDYSRNARAVGPPMDGVLIKLTDVKHLFKATDEPNPRGEIKVKGDCVFTSYWNEEDASIEVIDKDGWFSTGLIGELLSNGSLLVLGVKEELLLLPSQP